MTETPGAGTHGTVSNGRPYWRTDTTPRRHGARGHPGRDDHKDNSQILVRGGTIVHAEPGSPLWHAYGGEEGLHPAHSTQARP